MLVTEAKSCPICENSAVILSPLHRCQDYYDKLGYTTTTTTGPIPPTTLTKYPTMISIPLDLLLDIFGELHAFSDRTDILDRIKDEMEVS